MDTTAKQQVVERVKQAQNVLVTVSRNPSVDQLAACIGLTLLLNKLGKHATAVFSGAVPSTIEFLQPEKTIERNTDSLQDFIISLDKNKADKLRYKVEDDVVKIFITPYRTKISEGDLVFSHGDFNVEVVLALGVKDQTQIDEAIVSHGRILHDATVVSINAGDGKAPALGAINWQEPTASSLSEMLVSISESFGANLLDGQMATAFLTGIVSETSRFSNAKTSPKVMTMSAQLMAAGANQQLIASKLEPPKAPAQSPIAKSEAKEDAGTLKVEHGEKQKKVKDDNTPKPVEEEQAQKKDDSVSAEINIDQDGNIKVPGYTPVDVGEEISEETEPISQTETEEKTEDTLPEPVEEETEPEQKEEPPKEVTEDSGKEVKEEQLPEPIIEEPETKPEDEEAPMPGSHHFLDDGKGHSADHPFSASTQSSWETSETTDNRSEPDEDEGFLTHKDDLAKNIEEPKQPQPHIEKARNAVEDAFNAAPFDPSGSPVEALNSQPLPDVRPPEAETEDSIAPPEPPKVPPPIIPAPGVVIPSPFTAGNPVQKKIDEQTL